MSMRFSAASRLSPSDHLVEAKKVMERKPAGISASVCGQGQSTCLVSMCVGGCLRLTSEGGSIIMAVVIT